MKEELITNFEPKSPVSEVFRTLRTNIQFMSSNKQLKSILITSTMPEEGKSWVAANLAIAFAQANKKVLLIDCDMRKGRQFNIFNIKPIPGISNYLSGITNTGEKIEKNIFAYVQETEVENLYIIPSGNVPPNPSELLVSDKMNEIIPKLEDFFDMIIFDGTPSLLVTDAIIVSRIVDSTIIVTAYKSTKIENLKKVVKQIENVGGKIAGVVLNKVEVSQKDYKKKYYYGTSYNVPITNNVKPNKKNIEVETRELENIRIEKEAQKKERLEKELDEVKNFVEEKEIKIEKDYIDEEQQKINKKSEEQKTASKITTDKKTQKPVSIKKASRKTVEDIYGNLAEGKEEKNTEKISTEELLKDINLYLSKEKEKLK